MPLPNDVARCAGERCDRTYDCRRYIARTPWMPNTRMTDPDPQGADCAEHIPAVKKANAVNPHYPEVW